MTRIISRILCVDDDDDDVSLLEAAVKSVNGEITFLKCFGGKEALHLLRSKESLPDIILLDVNMPLLNGFDCLREIRKDKLLLDIPVFMISTSASPKDVAMALELGAHKFLTKPNTYSGIVQMINEILQDCLVEK